MSRIRAVLFDRSTCLASQKMHSACLARMLFKDPGIL
jgi:hypothetical protein